MAFLGGFFSHPFKSLLHGVELGLPIGLGVLGAAGGAAVGAPAAGFFAGAAIGEAGARSIEATQRRETPTIVLPAPQGFAGFIPGAPHFLPSQSVTDLSRQFVPRGSSESRATRFVQRETPMPQPVHLIPNPFPDTRIQSQRGDFSGDFSQVPVMRGQPEEECQSCMQQEMIRRCPACGQVMQKQQGTCPPGQHRAVPNDPAFAIDGRARVGDCVWDEGKGPVQPVQRCERKTFEHCMLIDPATGQVVQDFGPREIPTPGQQSMA